MLTLDRDNCNHIHSMFQYICLICVIDSDQFNLALLRNLSIPIII